jgi:hypothetical protein
MAVPAIWEGRPADRGGGPGRHGGDAAEPCPAGADGFRDPFQGAAVIARRSALVGQAHPTVSFYPPTGMARLPGMQISTGIPLVHIDGPSRAPPYRLGCVIGGFHRRTTLAS